MGFPPNAVLELFPKTCHFCTNNIFQRTCTKITLSRWDRYYAFCYVAFKLCKCPYFVSILACKESRICISVQNTNYSSMHNQACSSIRLSQDAPPKIHFLCGSEWSKASTHGFFITSLAIGMPTGLSSPTAIARAKV